MDPLVNQTVSQAQEPAQKSAAAEQQAAQQPAQGGLKHINLEERLKELESFLSERDKEISALKLNLEAANTRADEHARQAEDASGLVSFHEAAITKAQETIKQSAETIKARDAALATVLTAYRTAIMQAHPSIPEELVTGGTLEELQQSLNKAKILVEKIRAGGTGGAVTIPAGAPVRQGIDMSALSTREKILHGLRGNGK